MMKYDLGKNEFKNWIVSEIKFEEKYIGKTEAIFALGNGYIGLRSANEERYLNEKRDLFISGTFNKANKNEVTELPNVADVTEIEILINGKHLMLNASNNKEYVKYLNLKTGELNRTFVYLDEEGNEYSLKFNRFVAQDRLHVIVNRVEITPLSKTANIRFISGINGQVTNTGSQHFNEGEKRVYEYKYIQMLQETSESCITFIQNSAHNIYINGDKIEEKPELSIDRRKVTISNNYDLTQGQTLVIEKFSNIYTTRDITSENLTIEQIRDASLDEIKEISNMSYEILFNSNKEVWSNYWNDQNIVIEGNDYDQLAIRFAQYHLKVMTPSHDNRCGIAAKGLSGEGYKGHSFWDTEIFILPFYTYSKPEIARKLLEYRYLSIGGARKKAKDNGYEGAMYPWESAWLEDGEVTPVWGAVDIVTGKSTKIWSGFIEQHITSDITFAIWQYYMVTNDEDFMEKYGYEIMFDTAIFWASRLEWDEIKQRYHINEVIGPDEYKEHVDNDAFTNWLAYWTIETAINYYNKLKESNSEVIRKLESKLSLQNVMENWTSKLPKIYLPEPRDLDNVIPQNDTFLSLEDIDLTKYKNQEHIGSMFKDYNLDQVNKIQVVKQADVVMLLYLLEHKFSKEVKKANYDYYEKRTLHDSSLSLSTHSILASDIDEKDLAYKLFQEATKIDLGENMKTSDHGIHAASLGGLWQIVVNGFGGVRMVGGNLRINPKLPENWSRLSFSFMWKGNKLDIELTKEGIKIEVKDEMLEEIEILVYDKKYVLNQILKIKF
ncbi:MAG: glycosyl hydrolase family 65 protein [Leptotrichiaceae bacterium]